MNIKQIFMAVMVLSLVVMNCGQSDDPIAAEEAVQEAEVNEEALEVGKSHPVDTFIAEIEALTATVSPREYGVGSSGAFACTNKDYGQKQHVYCFDGGLQAREIMAYYDERGQIIVATFIKERFNASPANEAEFDETQTIRQYYKLVMIDNSFTDLSAVLDEHNEAAEWTESLQAEWSSFTSVIPPYIMPD